MDSLIDWLIAFMSRVNWVNYVLANNDLYKMDKETDAAYFEVCPLPQHFTLGTEEIHVISQPE